MKSNLRAAVIPLAVVLVLVGGAGWYLAVVRASELEVARNTLQADDARSASLNNDREVLQRTISSQQAQLTTARQSANQAQSALATARSSAADAATLRSQLTEANARANASAAQLQALQQKQATRTRPQKPQPHAAAPMFDLPVSASAHDYLVASEQALASGNLAKARAALGRAEVRALNAAELHRPSSAAQIERSHKIQHAIDMLDAGKTASALQAIKTLVAGTDQSSTQQ